MSIVLSIILICLVAVYFHFRRFRGSLDNGLPLVKPFLCFGSPPYRFDKIHYHKWFHEKFQQLGNTFARFDGVTPCICTIDPEVIKEITVKQFDNFTDVIDIDFEPGQTTLDVSRYVEKTEIPISFTISIPTSTNMTYGI